jgi:2-dehydropantoate 2-reductase
MNIGIIGGGSIGLLFASYLSEVSMVTIFTRSIEQAREINDNGIFLLGNGQQINISIKAMIIDEWDGKEDLTIVAVKQYQLGSVIREINRSNRHNKNLLFVQNGMGHLKLLSQLNAKNILLGSVEHGANKENPSTVRHNGRGAINLALYRGSKEFLDTVSSMFPSNFSATPQNDYFEMLVNKLIVNAVINPLTAILQVPNGELIKNPFYFTMLKNLFSEISSILNLKNPEEYLQKISNVCKNTANNRSSMLKDLEGGRKTEVDAILGFLLEEAEILSKNAPLITSFNVLVKGKEMERED